MEEKKFYFYKFKNKNHKDDSTSTLQELSGEETKLQPLHGSRLIKRTIASQLLITDIHDGNSTVDVIPATFTLSFHRENHTEAGTSSTTFPTRHPGPHQALERAPKLTHANSASRRGRRTSLENRQP